MRNVNLGMLGSELFTGGDAGYRSPFESRDSWNNVQIEGRLPSPVALSKNLAELLELGIQRH